MTMQHRFKMPPGGSARDCWQTPVGCSRIAPAIIESREALEREREWKAYVKAHPPLPYGTLIRHGFRHRTQQQVRIDEEMGCTCVEELCGRCRNCRERNYA
jgi:hypothetical protein